MKNMLLNKEFIIKDMKKVICILIISSIALTAGVTVAYYNTSSLGYDNANILYIDNDVIRIFDMTIQYKKIQNKIEKIKKDIDKFSITI